MSNPQNLDAKRALYAFTVAEYGNKEQAKNKKFNYSAAVQELPSMIRMNGLRAAMAFFYPKESKEKAHGLIFKQILNWFKDENEPTKMMSEKIKVPNSKKPEAFFMEILLKLSDDEYRIVQAETLTMANWMIRFVKDDSTSKPEGDEQSQI